MAHVLFLFCDHFKNIILKKIECMALYSKPIKAIFVIEAIEINDGNEVR